LLAECVSFIVPLNSMSLHVRLHFQTIYLHHQFRCSYCVGLYIGIQNTRDHLRP